MRFFSVLISISLFVTIIACNQKEAEATYKEPVTKEDLGELLFFDTLLSKNNSISCASCHLPAYAFSDTTAFSKGANGEVGTRNTPSVMNLSARNFFFHDGRAESLEQQAAGPMENPVE
ncbi:MAG: cytochrome-c peroxidase, partial [Bacteroidota bacterium]|nr:cytochrome-c peroxidase [Bacteroidota bacterium]